MTSIVPDSGDTPALQEVYSSPLYTLSVAVDKRVALLRRSDVRYSDLAQLNSENERVTALFRSLRSVALVVDMRAAPANNDERFEAAMRTLRKAVAKIFGRVVVLVASAAGEMQVTRIHRGEQLPFLVARESGKAWRLATGAA